MMRIMEVRQGTGGRVEFRTLGKHQVTGTTSFNITVGGWDGVTDFAHPANGRGVDVTPVDEDWLAIPGTVLSLGSEFVYGVCWRASDTLIDAEPSIGALMDRVKEAGGGIVDLPAGFLNINSTWRFREGVTLIGRGMDATFIFANDNLLDHTLQDEGVGNWHFSDFTLLCNRQWRFNPAAPGAAYHGIRFGADDVTTRNVTLLRFRIWGAKGYAIGCQGHNTAFAGFKIQGEINECSSDGNDWKNRAEGNDLNEIDLLVQNFGLGRIGRSNWPAYTLQANPFTTVNGSPNVTVTHFRNGFRIGIKVTFSGASVVNGIDMNGTFTIIAKTASGYVVTAGNNANNGSSGGGTGVLERGQQFSQSDAAVDLRGRNFRVVARVRSALFSRTGVRCRGGTAASNNGEGATWTTIEYAEVINTATSRSTANGISLLNGARGVVVKSAMLQNLNQGLLSQAGTQDCSYNLLTAHDCNLGASLAGNGNKLTNSTFFACGTGLALLGGTATDANSLPEDAFTTTAGSNVVTVYQPGHSHADGDHVTIDGAEIFDDVDPNVSNHAIDVIDGDHYTITVSSNAVVGMEGGGDNATYSFGTISTGAYLITDNINTHGCTIPINVGAGVTAAQMGARQGYGDTNPIIDNGTSTVWTPAL